MERIVNNKVINILVFLHTKIQYNQAYLSVAPYV